jgi:hypothetical protein
MIRFGNFRTVSLLSVSHAPAPLSLSVSHTPAPLSLCLTRTCTSLSLCLTRTCTSCTLCLTCTSCTLSLCLTCTSCTLSLCLTCTSTRSCSTRLVPTSQQHCSFPPHARSEQCPSASAAASLLPLDILECIFSGIWRTCTKKLNGSRAESDGLRKRWIQRTNPTDKPGPLASARSARHNVRAAGEISSAGYSRNEAVVGGWNQTKSHRQNIHEFQ